MWYHLCGARYVVQSSWFSLCGPIYVAQPMWCNLCGAIYVVHDYDDNDDDDVSYVVY